MGRAEWGIPLRDVLAFENLVLVMNKHNGAQMNDKNENKTGEDLDLICLLVYHGVVHACIGNGGGHQLTTAYLDAHTPALEGPILRPFQKPTCWVECKTYIWKNDSLKPLATTMDGAKKVFVEYLAAKKEACKLLEKFIIKPLPKPNTIQSTKIEPTKPDSKEDIKPITNNVMEVLKPNVKPNVKPIKKTITKSISENEKNIPRTQQTQQTEAIPQTAAEIAVVTDLFTSSIRTDHNGKTFPVLSAKCWESPIVKSFEKPMTMSIDDADDK